jgi:hypothetical protein
MIICSRETPCSFQIVYEKSISQAILAPLSSLARNPIKSGRQQQEIDKIEFVKRRFLNVAKDKKGFSYKIYCSCMYIQRAKNEVLLLLLFMQTIHFLLFFF